jgi:parallel beta-helix repeat protein
VHYRRAVFALTIAGLISLCTFAAIEVKANPRTLVVPDEFSTIAEAVANAKDGDIIFAMKGTHNITETLMIDKSLTLQGEGAEATIINGPGYAYAQPRKASSVSNPSFIRIIAETEPANFVKPPVIAIQIAASNVKILNFTITRCDISVSASGAGLVVTGNSITTSDTGIVVAGDYATIAENNIASTYTCIKFTGNYGNIKTNQLRIEANEGIILRGANNVIYGNNIIPAFTGGRYTDGVDLEGDSNIIAKNIIVNGSVGIAIKSGDRNIVCGNSIANLTFQGIWIFQSDNNLIYGNTLASNYKAYSNGNHDGYGVSLSGNHFHAENNTFYHNNFINNFMNARVRDPRMNPSSYPNTWDNGAEGNYWSDFNGTDADGDSIADVAYTIDSNNTDHYPLMEPVDISTVDIQLPEQTANPNTQTPSAAPIDQPINTVPPTQQPPSFQPSPFLTQATLTLIAIVAAAALILSSVYFLRKNHKKQHSTTFSTFPQQKTAKLQKTDFTAQAFLGSHSLQIRQSVRTRLGESLFD